ncbi:PF00070 family, FAD-dependent NAD(P)-disulphide oxidoreductase [Alloactinosynnema sp. L-07]|uniref:dihydrolipoyl dehydrogenase family protein n=1 Tax=Alloactinosynnema sp. L-07 TaxID=1653480 RepID=UPI00065F0315|nr:NAD(P)/FAD-dependent oxidoreductase [Alloactinosynnema sp. L-07]CRK61469.1 PF00070 family, FAD-dependent NAD(P)-disulphide oxidoreductase [Alloactinosynnema sp. L-07]
MTRTVDIAVVGLGPGGESAAAKLAKAGLDVLGIDARLVGGECPYYACVPTKMMIRAADALAEARRVEILAGSAVVRPDWRPVAARIRADATGDWDDGVAVDRLTKAGAAFLRGRARIVGANRLVVSTSDGEETVETRRGIVLNPGTDPAVPPVPGLADVPHWTNRDAVAVTSVPESLIVLGGGPVGCEFAQVFARFGAKVTIVEAQDRLLPLDEPESGALIAERFAAEGITVKTGAKITGASHDGRRVTLTFDGADPVTAAHVLVAAGRRTDLAALGVGAVGLDESARGIEVDGHMRAADGVWAIGDVTGKGAFTHMSLYQAEIAVADILGEPREADYRAVPRVTFTDPEIGSVGLSESAARAAGLAVRTGGAKIAESSRGWIHKVGNEGFVKLVMDADRDILVGATAAGPAGGEVLGALAVAVHGEVPVSVLQRMIFAYPTFHRAIGDALKDL